MSERHHRPFRFGVLTKGTSNRKAWLDLLAKVEGSGFGALHIPLHSSPQFSPVAALADAAARTSLTVATLVHNNDLQHPALLARDATTLALLSEGRFILGIGAGWKQRDYRELGIPMSAGRDRVDRLTEAIEILRGCWRGEPFSFHGRHYAVEELCGLPGPRVPLMVGAGGNRMLRFAAQTADIVSFTRDMSAGTTPQQIAADLSLESTERKAKLVRQELGSRSTDADLHILVVRAGVGTDADHEVRDYISATGVSDRIARETPEHLLGADSDELVEVIEQRRERTGINYYVFRDVHLDRVRPLVQRLAGT
jgi:probable F420-dependent oxidoreductase